MAWPMIEPALVAGLRANRIPAGTELPGDIQDRAGGFVRVQRGPGADDGVTDTPLIDVEAFAPSQLAAWDLAEQARETLYDLAGTTCGDGVLIDTVRCAVSPAWVFYGPHVHRYVASYRVSVRKH